jgi:hypothetical protein
MADIRSNPCRRPARHAFPLIGAADTKEKELSFWLCDIHYEEFTERFPPGQLTKIKFDAHIFLAGGE